MKIMNETYQYNEHKQVQSGHIISTPFTTEISLCWSIPRAFLRDLERDVLLLFGLFWT